MVSIIVPNYNHAQFLKERIDSILNQTYQDFELILLDDCSKDNSREILDSYKHNKKVSHIVFNKQNSGTPFAQWRKGVDLAKGEWIWIAESDDVANELFLESLINVTANRNVGLVYCHIKWIDSEGNFMFSQDNIDEYEYYTGKKFIEEKLLYTTTIFNVSSAIIRKDILNQIEWDKLSNMKMCGDYYFYFQLSSISDVCECKLVLDSFRQHNKNTSGLLAKKGWSFIEGITVINEIVQNHNIPAKKYSLYYARMWAKCDFNFNVDINVAKSFLKHRYYLVFLFFIPYKFKRIINNKIK